MKYTGVAKNIDSYIDTQPESIQDKLIELRKITKDAVPKAEEVISYMMPAFKQHGVLVYFAGCQTHIGFYPTPSGVKAFEKELTGYKYSKGAIQFPLDKPLPVGLVKKIVKYRAKEDKEAAQLKTSLKKLKTQK